MYEHDSRIKDVQVAASEIIEGNMCDFEISYSSDRSQGCPLYTDWRDSL